MILKTIVMSLVGLLSVTELARGDRSGSVKTIVTPRSDQVVCSKDEDCLVVPNSCKHCCGEDAVSSKASSAFKREVADCTSKYPGPQCKCTHVPHLAKCVSQKCTLKEYGR